MLRSAMADPRSLVKRISIVLSMQEGCSGSPNDNDFLESVELDELWDHSDGNGGSDACNYRHRR